jgi:hypothetical protein
MMFAENQFSILRHHALEQRLQRHDDCRSRHQAPQTGYQSPLNNQNNQTN